LNQQVLPTFLKPDGLPSILIIFNSDKFLLLLDVLLFVLLFDNDNEAIAFVAPVIACDWDWFDNAVW